MIDLRLPIVTTPVDLAETILAVSVLVTAVGTVLNGIFAYFSHRKLGVVDKRVETMDSKSVVQLKEYKDQMSAQQRAFKEEAMKAARMEVERRANEASAEARQLAHEQVEQIRRQIAHDNAARAAADARARLGLPTEPPHPTSDPDATDE